MDKIQDEEEAQVAVRKFKLDHEKFGKMYSDLTGAFNEEIEVQKIYFLGNLKETIITRKAHI